MLNTISRGCGLNAHRCHCSVSLNKVHSSLLSIGWAQEKPFRQVWNTVGWDVKNHAKKISVHEQDAFSALLIALLKVFHMGKHFITTYTAIWCTLAQILHLWAYSMWTSSRQSIKSPAQGHDAVPPVRLNLQPHCLQSGTLPLSHRAPTCTMNESTGG